MRAAARRTVLATCLGLAACGGSRSSDGPPPAVTPPQVVAPGGSGRGSGSAATPPDAAPAAPSDQRELVTVPAEVAAKVALRPVATGLKRPVLVVAAPGDPRKRLFVLEQHVGRIRVIEGGVLAKAPLLDIGKLLSTGNEQGLLGLALHPDFLRNGRAFINYTGADDATHIVELRYDEAAGTFAPKVFTPRWSLAQPYSNHNGGHLQFGPDGKLYVGMGDGGSAGDPLEAGQDPGNLLAKILRFDVDAAGAWTPEVVHLGVRNPWRFDFDPRGGTLFIGDVGQDAWENIYAVPGGDPAPRNFGWSVSEGAHCYGRATCDQTGFTPPIVDYPHSAGCSVTGGVVYRGAALPALDGAYFYADYCTGLLRSLRFTPVAGVAAGGVVRDHWDWKAALDPDGQVAEVASFGRDADGEVYVVSLRGSIWQLAPR